MRKPEEYTTSGRSTMHPSPVSRRRMNPSTDTIDAAAAAAADDDVETREASCVLSATAMLRAVVCVTVPTSASTGDHAVPTRVVSRGGDALRRGWSSIVQEINRTTSSKRFGSSTSDLAFQPNELGRPFVDPEPSDINEPAAYQQQWEWWLLGANAVYIGTAVLFGYYSRLSNYLIAIHRRWLTDWLTDWWRAIIIFNFALTVDLRTLPGVQMPRPNWCVCVCYKQCVRVVDEDNASTNVQYDVEREDTWIRDINSQR